MKQRLKKFIPLLILFLASCQIQQPTNLTVASLFQDHMVAQQDTLITVWGWANAGTEIKLVASWGKEATALSDSLGSWQLKLPTPKADHTSHQMTISAGKEKIKIEDVMMGEVWLASGQSNMEMPMKVKVLLYP